MRPAGSDRAPGSSGPVSPNGEPSGAVYYGFRPNVRFGIQGSDQLKLYKELDNGARLPQKKPVAISLGVSSDGKKVLFGLTPEVILVKARRVECVGGAQGCLFLSLKAGEAATLFTANPGTDLPAQRRQHQIRRSRSAGTAKRPASPVRARKQHRHCPKLQ